MTLKFKLPNLDGLDDSIKSLYKEANGEYVLSVEGMPSSKGDDKQKELDAILKKNQELLDEVKKFKRDKQDLEAKQKAEAEAKAKENGDFESLLKSAQEKIAEKDARIKDMLDKNNQTLLNNTSMAMAAKLCDGSNVSLILPHIKSRLKVDESGEIKVLNKSGEATVSTQDELITEFQSNKDYAPILRGTQSSGGGASGGSSGGAGVPNQEFKNPVERLKAAYEAKK